jgi:uncharacterized membrane protein SpoIIM required for sporulation
VSKRTRLASFGIFVGVFLLACTIGGSYKMSGEEQSNFLNQFQSATAGIDAIGIFTHNLTVALPMFIPGFGIAWGSFTAWSTGAAFDALIVNNPQLSSLSPTSLFLLSPFGVLELGAYSIGMSRSFTLIWRIIKRNPLKKEIRNTGIEIGISVAILLVAGFVESSIISQSVSHVSLSGP